MTDKPPPLDPAGLAPRRAALALLHAVLAEGCTLDEASGTLARLAPPERARAERLALAVLRNLQRADRVLAPHLAKTPPPAALAVLRLATVELCADRAAPHGVVDAAVRLVRAGRRTRHLAGLANAVLRKVAAGGPEIWQAAPPDMMPPWLRSPLVHAWGREAVRGMEAAHAAGAPLDLTLKDPEDRQGWAAALGARHLPTGSLRLDAPGRVSALPGFAEGAWWVQAAAAAIAARVAGDVAGARVLDLCAAPGGKTMQLAAAGADVTALDISGPRMARLGENLTRTGLVAHRVVADALHWRAEVPFDLVLLDAPCSATGTIRRHPDLPHVTTAADVEALAALQAALIDRAVEMVRPGGDLVFCTCSLLPEEGEAQVARALERHAGLRLRPIAPEPLGLGPELATPEGLLRLRPDHWPELGGMDGFCIARLARD
ncbi:16S rRNA methyltransferase [Maritimibacter sp. 55A14]|uniref:RsmB/NOP family class I SAM-dependent RNA methyltransferase n=1 Tax=Maritimibacter sp. 55A14 TaxID=2174844 RepID=UPI000D62147B|nr:transcription antitermination factor NusB [Maritimibacter sp. 55A14]PWE29396.1 16S rRNA methyltransferase [Maritimibacter sp. 55A14]